ncbi:porin [Cereibacter sphaeroides]|uniref:porin n=1 Tax=Rhodobacterales TaxID=204455 RepID=UPI000BBE115E|nr:MULTISPECIES: porin [Paracoccaceae]MCE6949994.1 porin [Cereibacter sphaeroides]
MKQILLATTALVMTAGVAAAEITFSGTAEMGIVGSGEDMAVIGRGQSNVGGTEFHNDFNLIVTATGETDMGLSFGVSTEISKDEGEANGNFSADNTAAFISGAYGTLTMGEIDGAMDWAITENIGNPGSIGDDETTHLGYLGAFGDASYDNQIARYEYNFGDFGVAISAELSDGAFVSDDPEVGVNNEIVGDSGENYAVGGKYSGDFGGFGLGFGLAYQTFDDGAITFVEDVQGIGEADVDILAVSATADFNNGFKAGIEYSDWSAENDAGQDLDFAHMAISGGFVTGAFEIGANYGVFDFDTEGAADKIEGYGIAAAYDLGGGLKVHGGYGDSDVDGIEGDWETYSVGVSMSF